MQLKPASATNGPVNAQAPSGPHLPLVPGTTGERRAFTVLLDVATRRGLGGARVHGYVAPPRPYAGEALHAAVALSALAAVALGVTSAAWVLGVTAVSAGAAALGQPSAAAFLPRRAAWMLILRGAGSGTRHVVGAALDRVRPTPALPWVAFGAVALALLASPFGPRLCAVGAVPCLAIAAYALWRGRPFAADLHGPEAEAALALLALAERAPADTAVVLTGGGAADGSGIAAFVDWWGLDPAEVELHVVPAPGEAAATLSRAGWRVVPFSPDRSPS